MKTLWKKLIYIELFKKNLKNMNKIKIIKKNRNKGLSYKFFFSNLNFCIKKFILFYFLYKK